MSRSLRIEYPGALYHITSRGNARQKTYLSKTDYNQFIFVLKDVIKRYNWVCYTYCLMPNHYHLVIETPEANLSAGMRQLNGVYTQKFNYIHKRVGHLFQGRYKAMVVEKESYLGELIRYVVLNPVRAKLVKNPEHWRWSGHREVLSKESDICINRQKLISVFETAKNYKEFISQKTVDESPWDKLKGDIILGSYEFIEKIKHHFSKNGKDKEISKKARFVGRPKLKEIIINNDDNKDKRNKQIITAYLKYGYTQKEISDYLQVHYSLISKTVKGKS